MGYTLLYPQLLEYFTKHIGEILNTNDIAKDLKVADKQVKGAVNTLLGQGHDIDSVSRGNAFIYRGLKQEIKPSKPTSRRMFEEIGMTKSGALVIQDTEGNLYKAVEIQ